MYINNLIKLFKYKTLKILIPYITMIFLLVPAFIGFSILNSYTNKIDSSIDFDDKIIKITGKTTEIPHHNLFLRLDEEFAESKVVPFAFKYLSVDKVDINVVGTSLSFFELSVNLEGQSNSIKYIDGVPDFSDDMVVVNTAFNDQNKELIISNKNLKISAIIDDKSIESRIYISFITYDKLIENISETLENGNLVYHFDRIDIKMPVKADDVSIQKVEELIGNNALTKFRIVTRDTIKADKIASANIYNDFNIIILNAYLVVIILFAGNVIMASIKRRNTEFTIMQVTGQKNRRILCLSLLENGVFSIISLFISLILSIIISFIVLHIINFEIVLISFGQILTICISLVLGIIIINFCLFYIMIGLKRNYLVRKNND